MSKMTQRAALIHPEQLSATAKVAANVNCAAVEDTRWNMALTLALMAECLRV